VHLGEHFQSSQEIKTVTPSHTKATGLSIDVPEKLKRLAKWWLGKVEEEMSVERANVLRIARATPISEIKAHGKPKASSAIDRMANVRKRRPSP
jgi:hypothetical protein